MKIKKGGTRIVMVFEKFVIKIPRIKIFMILGLVVKHLLHKKLNENVEGHNHKLGFVVISYLLVGFMANAREYILSKKIKQDDSRLLRVKWSIYGLLEVQEKGEALYKNHPKWKAVKQLMRKAKIKDYDALTWKNYSLHNNQVCLHDYGGQTTISEIDKILAILKKCTF
jgi:hypothetical protein